MDSKQRMLLQAFVISICGVAMVLFGCLGLTVSTQRGGGFGGVLIVLGILAVLGGGVWAVVMIVRLLIEAERERRASRR